MSGNQRVVALLSQAWVPLSPPQALQPFATPACGWHVQQSGYLVTAATSLPSRAVISQVLLGPSAGLSMPGMAQVWHSVCTGWLPLFCT